MLSLKNYLFELLLLAHFKKALSLKDFNFKSLTVYQVDRK